MKMRRSYYVPNPATLKLLSLTMIVGFISLLSSGCAVAVDNPFVGRWHWDGQETCVKQYSSDNVALQITPKQLVFYENTCAISSMRKLGPDAYKLRLSCNGEGETGRNEILLTLLKKSKVNEELLLRVEPASGFALAYRRCE
jgi:hypothetical protein